MIISSNNNNKISALGGTQPTFQGRSAAAASVKDNAEGHFDQIVITAKDHSGSAFQIELKHRLSREMQTATPADHLDELRQQIGLGLYRVDPYAIAQKILMPLEG